MDKLEVATLPAENIESLKMIEGPFIVENDNPFIDEEDSK